MTRNRTVEGSAHSLIVHAVGWPYGPLDEDDVEYDLQHLPSCTSTEEEAWGGLTVTVWDCAVAWTASEIGLAYALDTPVTKPGTYTVQAWSAEYWTDCGTEYDAGLAVTAARPESHGHCRACHPEQVPKPLAVNGHDYQRRRKARQRRKQ